MEIGLTPSQPAHLKKNSFNLGVDKSIGIDYNKSMNSEQTDYTVTTLAQTANVHRTYIARLCKQGKIPAKRVGFVWIIRYEDGQRWLEERQARLSEEN